MHDMTILFWFVIFIMLGFIWYIVDRAQLRRPYRWLHNITHEKEKELPVGAEKAFIYGQSTQRRFYIAIVISFLQIVPIAHFSSENNLTYLVIWLLGIPALMLGFFCGPQINRLWQKKGELFAAVDKVESGETKIAPNMMSSISRVGKDFMKYNPIFGKKRSAPIPEPPDEPAVAAEPEIDGRAAIDRFTNHSNT